MVYTVEFLLVAVLVALAFEHLRYLYLTVYEHAQETLQHHMVPLVAKKAFYHPIKSYVGSHKACFFLIYPPQI